MAMYLNCAALIANGTNAAAMNDRNRLSGIRWPMQPAINLLTMAVIVELVDARVLAV